MRAHTDKNPVIRSRAREIYQQLKEDGAISYIETEDIQQFKQLTKRIFSCSRHYDYFIPTNFGIGDAVVGLDSLRQIEHTFNITLGYVYSNYKSLETIFPLRTYQEEVQTDRHTKIFVYSTSDFELMKKYFTLHSKNSAGSIVIGMNLLFFLDKGKRYLYYCNSELYSVDDYSLSDITTNHTQVFFDLTSTKNYTSTNSTPNFLINPFGSVKIKTLPALFVYKLIRDISDNYPDAQMVVLTGFTHSWGHYLWKLQLQALLFITHRAQNAHLQSYTTFKDLFTTLKDTALVISTDTSISHISNYLNIRNISIFNSKKIGTFTRSNLFSKSPLGFILYGNNQFPALVINSDWKKLLRGILGFIDYFFKNNPDISWTKDLYDPEYILSQTPTMDDYTREVNKKIDPLYKIQNY